MLSLGFDRPFERIISPDDGCPVSQSSAGILLFEPQKNRGERGRQKNVIQRAINRSCYPFYFVFIVIMFLFFQFFFSLTFLLLLSSSLSRCAVYSFFGDISESSSHYLYVYWARPKSRLFFFHRLRLVVLLNIGKGGARLHGDFLAKEEKKKTPSLNNTHTQERGKVKKEIKVKRMKTSLSSSRTCRLGETETVSLSLRRMGGQRINIERKISIEIFKKIKK